MDGTARAWGGTANWKNWMMNDIFGVTRVEDNAKWLYEKAETKEGKGRKTKYFVMQWEKGTEGENDHMQFGVYFTSATSAPNVFKWLDDLFKYDTRKGSASQVHLEKLVHPKEWYDYCKKPESRMMKWMEWGEMPMENGKQKGWEVALKVHKEEGTMGLVGNPVTEYEFLRHGRKWDELSTLRTKKMLNQQGWLKLQKKVVCIYGPPGLGKTVMVNIMGRAWCAQKGKSGYIMMSDEPQWKPLYSGKDFIAIDEMGMTGITFKETLECISTSVCTVQIKKEHAF